LTSLGLTSLGLTSLGLTSFVLTNASSTRIGSHNQVFIHAVLSGELTGNPGIPMLLANQTDGCTTRTQIKHVPSA
jgi:hypothetical protein